MLIATTLLIALAAPAPPAPADTLHRDWISADAEWVVHLDVAAALGSELASLLDEAWESEEFQEVQWKLGLDPRRDVASVTAYGSADDPERPVILVLGDLQLEQALDRLAGELIRKAVTVDGVGLDRWSEGDDDDEAVYTYLARKQGSDQRVLVASPDRASAAAGVAVMRGEQTSLADDPGDFIAGGGPSAGAFFFVAVREGFARLEDIDPASRVAQLVDSAAIEGGEFQGETFLRLTVSAADETDARTISSILQGASSLATLVAQSEEEARPLLPLVQGLAVSSEASRVTVRFRCPSSKLIELAREARDGRGWRQRHHAPGAEDASDRQPRKAKPIKKDGWY